MLTFLLHPYVSLPALFLLMLYFLDSAGGLGAWFVLVLGMGLLVAAFELYYVLRFQTTLSDIFVQRYKSNRPRAVGALLAFSLLAIYLLFHLTGRV